MLTICVLRTQIQLALLSFTLHCLSNVIDAGCSPSVSPPRKP